MLHLKAQPTPLISSLHLDHDAQSTVDDSTVHHSIVGALQDLIIMGTKLSFSVIKA